MTDTTNTPTEFDTLVADVEEYAERVYGGLSKRLDALAVDLEVDAEIIWPYIKSGVVLLLSQVGKAAIAAEVAALPAIEVASAGGVSAALVTAGTVAAAAITSTVSANAEADAQLEIQDAQANGVTAETLEAPVVATVTE